MVIFDSYVSLPEGKWSEMLTTQLSVGLNVQQKDSWLVGGFKHEFYFPEYLG